MRFQTSVLFNGVLTSYLVKDKVKYSTCLVGPYTHSGATCLRYFSMVEMQKGTKHLLFLKLEILHLTNLLPNAVSVSFNSSEIFNQF